MVLFFIVFLHFIGTVTAVPPSHPLPHTRARVRACVSENGWDSGTAGTALKTLIFLRDTAVEGGTGAPAPFDLTASLGCGAPARMEQLHWQDRDATDELPEAKGPGASLGVRMPPQYLRPAISSLATPSRD